VPYRLPGGAGVGAGRTHPDPLYGEIRLPGWAETLLETAPFQRLRDVSLSDVPGELLFGRPFPSRLDHALGVFHLARLARPRDRALQVAALAHDLGHGPFSHLTEPLMRERNGEDHEQRSARLLRALPTKLTPGQARKLAWLNWAEAANLILAHASDGRGELLNGRLDYDNADNVARFLLASGLGKPRYDPELLARGLRLLSSAASPLPPSPAATMPADAAHQSERTAASAQSGPCRGVYLASRVANQARAWLADRAIVYTYLHEGHENLALHAMLRRAIDLAMLANALPPHFLEMTDALALRLLRRLPTPGAAPLAAAVCRGARYACLWEAELPGTGGTEAGITRSFGAWRERVALESGLAAEAALLPHEVVVEVIASSAGRTLPPLARSASTGELVHLVEPPPAPRRIHVFAPHDIGRDYARRLRNAAERRFGPLGAIPRGVAG
jgi:hypothetical protein